MSVFKPFKVFSLYVILLYACLACTSTGKQTADFTQPKIVVIDKNFKSEKLNNKLLICTNLKKRGLNTKNLRDYLLKNAKPTNAKRSMIMVGDYHKYPDAWFYIQIINTDDLVIDLVVDEDNHLRCDGLEVLTFKGDSLKNWGGVLRKTPFSERQIPFYPYAIPIAISPKDTLNLLIHTQRNYGTHEVNLNIASYPVFLAKIINQFLTQLVIIVMLVLCMLIMGIMGWLFKDKTMLYLSIYLISIALVLIGAMGVTDTLIGNPNTGLSVTDLASSTVFLANAFYHPYGMELLKSVPKNEKRFKTISFTLMGINILVACSFLLPLNLFYKIDVFLPKLMAFLSVLAICWLFYSSLLAYFRANIKYFFVAALIAFLPFLYEQFINIFFDVEYPLTLKFNQSSFLISISGVSIISIFQLKEKLGSRKDHEQNLTQLKETMKDIRKGEIETIGRNLHDQVGNTLASALGYMNLKTLKVDLVQKLIMDAINEIRFLSHNLVKDEDKPLTEKLETLVSRFNDFSNINFQYSNFSGGAFNELSQISQQNIYTIIQELLSNIIKHSHAKNAYVQLFNEHNILRANIEDDGCGFDSTQQFEGIGLQNIQKRAALMNLRLVIDSTNNGTGIIIEIPNENKSNNS